MTLTGWAQIALVLALTVAAAVPLGRYLAAVAEGRVAWLRPVEALFYRLGGIDAARGQDWRGYALAMLAANAAGFLLLFALLAAYAAACERV